MRHIKNLLAAVMLGVGSNDHMPLPKGAEIGYLQWEADGSPLFKYLEENQKEVKALGGRFDTSEAKDEAVGVAQLRSAEELSSLINIQTSVESAYIKLIGWCHSFYVH